MEKINLQDLKSQLLQLDPKQISINEFKELVEIIDGKLQKIKQLNEQPQASELQREIFQISDKLLIEFQKYEQSWQIVFQILQSPDLSDAQYFHAANIFKKKLKIDFVSIKKNSFENSNLEQLLQLFSDLLQTIQQFALNNKPKFILNSLCMGMAYMIFHLHQLFPGMQLLQNLSGQLGGTTNQITQLFNILSYVASECENDEIVIEESLRQSFFDYIDVISETVLHQIFEHWSQRLLNVNIIDDPFFKNVSQVEIMNLKLTITQCFMEWIKLKLPYELIIDLSKQNQNLIQLIFNQIQVAYQQTKQQINQEDILQASAECIIELLKLSKKKSKFIELNEYLIRKVYLIGDNIDIIIKEQNCDLGEKYQDIFIEIGRSSISQIIQNDNQFVLFILIRLMGLGLKSNENILQDIAEERIQARHQTSFWKDFIQQIQNIDSEAFKIEKIRKLELILISLIENIIKHLTFSSSQYFVDMNTITTNEDEFDEYFNNKRDLGKIVRDVTQLIGIDFMITFMQNKLDQAVLLAQQNTDNVQSWNIIHGVLTAFEQIARLVKIDELPMLQKLISIIFQLPYNQYLAFRFIITEIIEDLSYLLEEQAPKFNEQKNQNGNFMIQETQQFLKYIIDGLNIQQTKDISSKCFMSICKFSKKFLYVYTDEIMQSVLPKSLQNWRSDKCHQDILQGLAILICRLSDSDQQKCTQFLKQIIEQLFQESETSLQQIRYQQQQLNQKVFEDQINKQSYDHANDCLDLIAEFIKSCDSITQEPIDPLLEQVQDFNFIIESPFNPIFIQLWPFIKQQFQEFSHLERIMEVYIRIVKQIIKIIPNTFRNYMTEFLQIVIQKFEDYPFSSFIYAIEYCFKQYQQYEQFDNVFLEAFEMITLKCSRILISKQYIIQNPFIASDLFGLARQYLKQHRQIFFKCKYLDDLLTITCKAIGMQHQEAVEAHSEFIEDLLTVIRTDFKYNLRIRNLGLLRNIEFQQIQQIQINILDLNPNFVINPEQGYKNILNKEKIDQLISENEVKILKFILKNGNLILKEYMDKIIEVPNRQVLDDYLLTMSAICYTFADPNGASQFSQSLRSQIQNINNFNEINLLIHQAQNQEYQNLSLAWLSQSLVDIPINVFTDDEKKLLIQKFIQICDECGGQCTEQIENSSNSAQMAINTQQYIEQQNSRFEQYLKQKLQEYLEGEFNIIFKRARNHVRR